MNEKQLAPFLGKNCTSITGPLALSNLPSTVTESLLQRSFGSVSSIQGGLYITNNRYLPTLDSFVRLSSASIVSITRNPGLVDARLPSLGPGVETVVSDNRRLCQENFPFGSGGCSLIDTFVTFTLSGVSLGSLDATEQQQIKAAIIDLVFAGNLLPTIQLSQTALGVSVMFSATSFVDDSRIVLLVCHHHHHHHCDLSSLDDSSYYPGPGIPAIKR